MTKQYLILFFFTLFFLTACAVKAPVNHDTTIRVPDGDTPQIIFLNYHMQEDAAGEIQIKLTNAIVNEGVLKEQINAHRTARAADLKCIAFSAEEEVLSYIILPNPLRQSVEYEDENGNLARKEIQLEQADFFIRMQVPPGLQTIAIQQIGEEEKYLISTKIDN